MVFENSVKKYEKSSFLPQFRNEFYHNSCNLSIFNKK